MTKSITRSLTLTKLQRPRIGHGLVRRARLLEQLNTPHSLTFILAPAGYGKTTLLSTWLETCQMPTAWLSLDEHDNDLTVFVTGLIETLQGILPGAVDKTLTVLNGVTLPSPEALSHSLFNDLEAIQQDFILVLDDYQVIHKQAIHALLQELVSHLPRAMHLVLASRHDPPLPLARLRVLGHVVELRTPDLRLTLEEVAVFLREVMELSVDEQTIALLAAKTEGWPVGLRLAALSLRRQPTLEQTTTSTFASNRYVMDYLLAEVLSQLPISVQDFLIKTSFLDQLSSPLCEAVTGMADHMSSGEPILDWLDHADLFVVPVDEQRHWYRCHHLLRQLLSSRLQELYSPTEIATLQLRASAWFAANGYLDEALHQALAAHDWTAAVQVVTEHRHELMNQAQWLRLDRWVHLFPREVIDEQPDLLLIKVSLNLVQHQVSEIPALLDHVEDLLAQKSAEKDEALRGEVEARRCALNYYLGDWTRNLHTGQHALEKIPTEWWYLRGYARLFLGIGYQMSGDLTQAYATLYNGGDPERSDPYQKLRIGCACFLHWIAADLSGMAQAARRVLAMSNPADSAEIVSWSRYHLGLYDYQRNDLSAAEEQLLPLVMRPHTSDMSCFLNSAVLLARIRQAQHRPDEACAIVEALLSFALEVRSEVTLCSARAFQAELALRQGRLAEAVHWAETSGAFVPLPAPHAHVPALTWAIILLTQDTPASREQARQLLTQLDDYFTSIHYTVIRIRILALQAMLYHAEGDERQAFAALEKSIALAEPGGFLRLFVDLGPQLKPLLMRFARRSLSAAYLVAIGAAYGEDDGPTMPRERPVPDVARAAATDPIGLLTNREQDVLLLLDKRYTDKEIANTLSISAGTVSTHIRHLGDKLGVHGRRAIVQAAKARGLLV
jgi:LuxR family transcriptional regulator, maltose regulon positive regulatory protein